MEAPRQTSWLWYQESNSPNYNVQLSLSKLMFEAQTPFQHVQVVETHQFGKTLVLDGKTQSALKDEFMYHETLVHPVMLAHPCPKVVYIGGGGEMATAREILKHKSVEKVVMVDLDEQVVQICKEMLPEWNNGCVDDPRLEIVYDDAYAYLMKSDLKFDVIIMDIADPIEAGPAVVMYTKECYNALLSKMNPDGVFVTQSGACASYNFEECFTPVNSTLRSVFDFVVPFAADIPSFASTWGFNLAYNKANGSGLVSEWTPESVDKKLADRLIMNDLRYYDGITHRGLFSLPKYVRVGLAAESRVITEADPIFMY